MRKPVAKPAQRKPVPRVQVSMLSFLRENALNWLLLFIPVSIAAWAAHVEAIWVFLTAALALIPLAGLIGQATEELAGRTGPLIGGFFNATFGNAPELIIALLALHAGLFTVVKASITGSIIGNILLVLGISMLAGGWGREKQTFSRTAAGASAAMLFIAVVALVLPAVFDLVTYGNLHEHPRIADISLLVAFVLLLTYSAGLLFTLVTHHAVLSQPVCEPQHPRLSQAHAMALLLAATLFTALEAELLVGNITVAAQALGMTQFFIGVIVVAIVGNAAEHVSAVTMARKNKMDLSVTIATASSTQIALFVAPVLVIVSHLLGHPMSLVFNIFEIVGLACSVLILALVTLDGESNWFQGVQLTAVYCILAIVYYFVPA